VALASILGAAVLLGSSGGASPPTFFEARSTANDSVATVSGGGWVLLTAFGIDVRSTATIPLSNIVNTTGSGCTPTAVGGGALARTITVPAYSGSFGAGRAPLWTFLYRQSASGPFLLANVFAGASPTLANLTGAGCATNLSKVAAMPSTLVDSPPVASTAWSGSGVNASSFAAGDPAIDTLLMVATGSVKVSGYSFSGWAFEYAPCAPFGSAPLTNETAFVMLFGPHGTLQTSATVQTGCPSV